ncbi:MAG: hypothetical protein U1D30_11160 [Planctomycetota bacterium]
MPEPIPAEPGTDKSTRQRLPMTRKLLYAILPAALLVVVVETACLFFEAWNPAIHSAPLHDELAGITIADEDLFWRVQPNLNTVFQNARVRTNDLGLRNGAVEEKRPGEFRILSLGESTTFGDGVDDEKTYSAVLEKYLNRESKGTAFQVLNGGVPSYTCFQSLQFLKTRGIELKPDLVLFYHEFNDFLPASHRTSSNDLIGLSQTDRQRHGTTRNWIHRRLFTWSAFYRWLCRQMARWDIEKIQNDSENTSGFMFTPEFQQKVFHQEILPGKASQGVFLLQRVPAGDRAIVFRELFDFCRSHGIRLVVIHPSYKASAPHECQITQLCREGDVPLFEAHASLHAADIPPELLFQDHVHPTELGHRRLGEALGQFLLEGALLPSRSGGEERKTPR